MQWLLLSFADVIGDTQARTAFECPSMCASNSARTWARFNAKKRWASAESGCMANKTRRSYSPSLPPCASLSLDIRDPTQLPAICIKLQLLLLSLGFRKFGCAAWFVLHSLRFSAGLGTSVLTFFDEFGVVLLPIGWLDLFTSTVSDPPVIALFDPFGGLLFVSASPIRLLDSWWFYSNLTFPAAPAKLTVAWFGRTSLASASPIKRRDSHSVFPLKILQ